MCQSQWCTQRPRRPTALPKTCTPAAPFWGDPRPGMTPLQVRPHSGLSPTSPGLPAWSKNQVPRVGRVCCCHQPCPLPAWLYPASTMAPIAPLALLPVGPQLLARPTSFSPIDLPDSTAVTAYPGTSFLQLPEVAGCMAWRKHWRGCLLPNLQLLGALPVPNMLFLRVRCLPPHNSFKYFQQSSFWWCPWESLASHGSSIPSQHLYCTRAAAGCYR